MHPCILQLGYCPRLSSCASTPQLTFVPVALLLTSHNYEERVAEVNQPAYALAPTHGGTAEIFFTDPIVSSETVSQSHSPANAVKHSYLLARAMKQSYSPTRAMKHSHFSRWAVEQAARFNRTYKFGAILGGSEEIVRSPISLYLA